MLGDGDTSLAFQSFELQKNPLTRISSAVPGGTESTLDVRVNGVRWSEVPSLFGHRPEELIYTTRVADDGTVTVSFGDGRSGARLPSGRRNVVAGYRKGSGLAGRVDRGTLRTPLDLPTGLKSVINPMPATGGADPEAIEQARENAPTTVRTFGRAVSLRDFEDLVRSSGEVAKAHATWVWNGEARAVHLTIAAQEGASFAPEDLARIHASVNAARDPNHALFLDNHVTVPISVHATLTVRPDHSREARSRGGARRVARCVVLRRSRFRAAAGAQRGHRHPAGRGRRARRRCRPVPLQGSLCCLPRRARCERRPRATQPADFLRATESAGNAAGLAGRDGQHRDSRG